MVEVFEDGVDEFSGALELVFDELQVASWCGGVAVDVVLADEDEGVGEDIDGDGETGPDLNSSCSRDWWEVWKMDMADIVAGQQIGR